MNHRVVPLIIATALLSLSCGEDDPIAPTYATLAPTTPPPPEAVATIPYSDTLMATGGDGNYTWSLAIGSLPAELFLNPLTGEISGTPTVVET